MGKLYQLTARHPAGRRKFAQSGLDYVVDQVSKYSPPLTQSQTKAAIFDNLCRDGGYEPSGIVGLIQALGRDSDIANVRFGHHNRHLFQENVPIHIEADYVGQEQFWDENLRQRDAKIREYFQGLGGRIGVKFTDAHCPFSSVATEYSNYGGSIIMMAKAILPDSKKIEIFITQDYKTDQHVPTIGKKQEIYSGR